MPERPRTLHDRLAAGRNIVARSQQDRSDSDEVAVLPQQYERPTGACAACHFLAHTGGRDWYMCQSGEVGSVSPRAGRLTPNRDLSAAINNPRQTLASALNPVNKMLIRKALRIPELAEMLQRRAQN